MQTFSAKDLCTRSCMQIRFFSENPDKRPKANQNIAYGESFQHKIAESVEGLIGEEMRGTYVGEGVIINFSNDIVTDKSVIEVKSVSYDRPVEEWYLKSSLLQCAVYSSLLRKTDGSLVTAKFFTDMGNPCVETKISNLSDYLLVFGNDRYSVRVKDADSIVRFIVRKANASLTWEGARRFDSEYKHREYDVLSSYFEFSKL